MSRPPILAVAKGGRRNRDGAAAMEAMLQRMQPDVLAAAADKLDGTLNNQSLVVLFTGARAIYDVRQEALRGPKNSARHTPQSIF